MNTAARGTPNNLRESIAYLLINLWGSLSSAINSRGLYRVAKLAQAFIPSGTLIQLNLNEDSHFSFDGNDPYWLQLLSPSYRYEPEIEALLIRMAKINYSFVDCGANLGYWSVLASSAHMGSHRAVAVEPMESTFSALTRNRSINDNRFHVVNAAIYHSDDRSLTFSNDPTAPSQVGAYAVGEASPGSPEGLPTTTVDTLLDRLEWPDSPIVLKLDVEGSEISALKGATNTMTRDCLIIYEDHGNDQSCAASSWFFDNNWPVYFLRDGFLLRARSLDEIKNEKTRTSVGYNFVSFSRDGVFSKLVSNDHNNAQF